MEMHRAINPRGRCCHEIPDEKKPPEMSYFANYPEIYRTSVTCSKNFDLIGCLIRKYTVETPSVQGGMTPYTVCLNGVSTVL